MAKQKQGLPYVRIVAYEKNDSKSATYAHWFGCEPEHAKLIAELVSIRFSNVTAEERVTFEKDEPKPWAPGSLWTPELVVESLDLRACVVVDPDTKKVLGILPPDQRPLVGSP